MGEYENNSTTNNYTSENDLASCHGPRTKKTDEESNLRPSDSALRCPTTEPQRLYGERGQLRS